jgi:hypothetical protein
LAICGHCPSALGTASDADVNGGSVFANIPDNPMETAQSGATAETPNVDPSGAIDKAVSQVTGIKEPRPRPEFSASSYAIPMGREFQQVFGPGRSRQAELIQRRELESFLDGDKRGRRMIIVQSYLNYIKRQQQREATGKIGAASPNPRARNRRRAAIAAPSETTAAAPAASKKRTERLPRKAKNVRHARRSPPLA